MSALSYLPHFDTDSCCLQLNYRCLHLRLPRSRNKQCPRCLRSLGRPTYCKYCLRCLRSLGRPTYCKYCPRCLRSLGWPTYCKYCNVYRQSFRMSLMFGAKVLVIFILEQRKYHRNESSISKVLSPRTSQIIHETMNLIRRVTAKGTGPQGRSQRYLTPPTGGPVESKKLLPVRTGLVAKSITSPEMFRYSTAASCTCALLAVHAHCWQYGCSTCLKTR